MFQNETPVNETPDATPSASPDRLAANRENATRSTGPKSADGKLRSKFNATRHGLTSQVACMPWEDREAFDRFCAEMVADYRPEGPIEVQLAQSIAEDHWRLNRARSTEHNIFALGHATAKTTLKSESSQVDTALCQAQTFLDNPNAFALMTLYEQRINRNIIRNEDRLAARQAERRAALDQAVEEARILADLAHSKGEMLPGEDPTMPYREIPSIVNGFVFSSAEVTLLLARRRRLTEAHEFQIASAPPKNPTRKAA